MSELNTMGSRLRNPVIAAVLYDLNFAETKGSGIRTMQRLLQNVGLTKPVFASDREGNQFTATFLLHQLLDEEQLNWLQQFQRLNLSDDEAKALVLVREMRAIDNAALREVTGLDTLAASQVLRHLCQYHLIEKGGNGPASYYKPTEQFQLTLNTSDLPLFLQNDISTLTPRARKTRLWPVILELCSERPYSAEKIATILGRKMTSLKTGHLTPLRKKGLINYLFLEVVNHPEQAYCTTEKGKRWLLKHTNGGNK